MSLSEKLKNKTHFKFRPWVGKKVEIQVNGEKRVGNLTYAGVNILHGHFQVTLNRTPYWPVNMNSIKHVEG